eukprot:jgi/Botrbrau1/7205/Bobra.0300s0031.1
MRALQEHDGCNCLMAAAEAGTKLAMVVLGLCYESGRGVRKDLEGAYLHFHQAARLDYEVGIWFLNELVQEHQDSFRSGMSRAASTASTMAGAGSMPHAYNNNNMNDGSYNGMNGMVHGHPGPAPPHGANGSFAPHVPWGVPAPLAGMSQSHQFTNHVHFMDPSLPHVQAVQMARDAASKAELLKRFVHNENTNDSSSQHNNSLAMEAMQQHPQNSYEDQPWRPATVTGVPHQRGMVTPLASRPTSAGLEMPHPGQYGGAQVVQSGPPSMVSEGPWCQLSGRRHTASSECSSHVSLTASPRHAPVSLPPRDGGSRLSRLESDAAFGMPGSNAWPAPPEPMTGLPPSKEEREKDRRYTLPPVPVRDRVGKQDKARAMAGAHNNGVQNFDPVSISRDPSSRGVSLADSLCGPNTPAYLSNFPRMMSNTSERSTATLEEVPHSHQPSSGPQADDAPRHLARKPSPGRSSSRDPSTERPWSRPPPHADSPSLSQMRDCNALHCSDSPNKAASHTSSGHSEARYQGAAHWDGGPSSEALPPRYGAGVAYGDGTAQRPGPPPLPQGTPSGAATSPDGSSTVSVIKTPPTPPQQGGPHMTESPSVLPQPSPPPVKTLQELSPFDAQRMMPFDECASPQSSRSDRSSQRPGMMSEEASPHAGQDPGSAHDNERGGNGPEMYFREALPAHEAPASRGSSMNSRHGLLTLELRQALASRSSSAMSRGSGSSGGASAGREGSRGDPLMLSENSNLSIRTAIRQRAENLNSDWSGASSNIPPLPRGPVMSGVPTPVAVPSFRPASQPSSREGKAAQIATHISDPPKQSYEARSIFDNLKSQLQGEQRDSSAQKTRPFEADETRIVFREPGMHPKQPAAYRAPAGESGWSQQQQQHVLPQPARPYAGEERVCTPPSRGGAIYNTGESLASRMMSPDSHRVPAAKASVPQTQLQITGPPDAYRASPVPKPVLQNLGPNCLPVPVAQRLLPPAVPLLEAGTPSSVKGTVPSTPRAPEPAAAVTTGARPTISALHPWPRPVLSGGDGQGDAVVIHPLRAFLGSSTIAVAHALLVTVRELEREVKEIEEALVHLRAAVATCPEIAPLISVREQMLSTLNWHLAAQREIHEHFLSHASHIARLDAAAF